MFFIGEKFTNKLKEKNIFIVIAKVEIYTIASEPGVTIQFMLVGFSPTFMKWTPDVGTVFDNISFDIIFMFLIVCCFNNGTSQNDKIARLQEVH